MITVRPMIPMTQRNPLSASTHGRPPTFIPKMPVISVIGRKMAVRSETM